MIASGVPVGASTPHQLSITNPGTVSATAGTPGTSGVDFGPVTPSARTRPDFTCGNITAISENTISRCPPIRSLVISDDPLYGICTMSTLVMPLNNSAASCEIEPGPLEPKLSRALAVRPRATVMSSLMFFAGTDGCTTTICGPTTASEIGARSRTVSYPSLR